MCVICDDYCGTTEALKYILVLNTSGEEQFIKSTEYI